MLAGLIATAKLQPKRLVAADDVKSVLLMAQEVSRWTQAAAIAAAYLPDSQEVGAIMRSESIRRFIMIRGHAYAPHGRRFAEALIGPYADAGSLGTALSDALTIADAYVVRVRTGWVEVTNRVWREAESATNERPGSLDEASEEFMDSFLGGLLNAMPPLLMLSRDELAALLPGPRTLAGARADQMLDVFAVGRGAWVGGYESPLADPPLRSRPFLLIPEPLTSEPNSAAPAGDEDSRVLLVHHDGLFGDAHLTIDAIMAERVSRWPRARARTVDRLTVELLRERLPGSRSAVGVFYREEGAEPIELDGLVLYEDRAIVIEGKGSPLRLPSRRGDAERLKRQLVDTITVGWAQLERDMRIITEGEADLLLLDHRGNEILRANRSDIRRVYPILPTFDRLHDVGTHLSDLYDYGVLAPGVTPLIVSVTDLQLALSTQPPSKQTLISWALIPDCPITESPSLMTNSSFKGEERVRL